VSPAEPHRRKIAARRDHSEASPGERAQAEVTGAPMPRETMLARTLVELADTLVADFDVVDLLTRLVDRCVDVLDVGAAGIMLAAPDGGLRVMASSSEAMRVLELFEVQGQEGPCLDCYRSGQPVLNQDLATVDGRWPRFVPEALAVGFHSVHALPLRLRGTVLGALNLFHVESGPMRQPDLDAAQALADVASIAILQHRATVEAHVLNEQLTRALNTRVVIEQAKGVLAEREGLTMGDAFAVLRHHARNHNFLLADVAADVISGALVSSALDRPPAV
jgi:GAF domain-containing protein